MDGVDFPRTPWLCLFHCLIVPSSVTHYFSCTLCACYLTVPALLLSVCGAGRSLCGCAAVATHRNSISGWEFVASDSPMIFKLLFDNFDTGNTGVYAQPYSASEWFSLTLHPNDCHLLCIRMIVTYSASEWFSLTLHPNDSHLLCIRMIITYSASEWLSLTLHPNDCHLLCIRMILTYSASEWLSLTLHPNDCHLLCIRMILTYSASEWLSLTLHPNDCHFAAAFSILSCIVNHDHNGGSLRLVSNALFCEMLNTHIDSKRESGKESIWREAAIYTLLSVRSSLWSWHTCMHWLIRCIHRISTFKTLWLDCLCSPKELLLTKRLNVISPWLQPCCLLLCRCLAAAAVHCGLLGWLARESIWSCAVSFKLFDLKGDDRITKQEVPHLVACFTPGCLCCCVTIATAAWFPAGTAAAVLVGNALYVCGGNSQSHNSGPAAVFPSASPVFLTQIFQVVEGSCNAKGLSLTEDQVISCTHLRLIPTSRNPTKRALSWPVFCWSPVTTFVRFCVYFCFMWGTS